VTPPLDWTERGRDLGATLNEYHAVVVLGSDPVATAEVALGLARVQAMHRRVAVGDLFGEAPPLQALVDEEDAHGIVDSFLFGVSLNRIARQVPDSGELFVMPSGTAPIDPEELFAHPRWKRLAAGFREVGALLVLVAPAEAAHLRDLVDSTDGAIIVGDTVPADIPVAQSLAWLRSKRSGPTALAGPAPLAQVQAQAPRPMPPRDRSRIAAGVAGLLLTLALVGVGIWFAQRPFAKDHAPQKAAVTPENTAAATAGTLTADSLAKARADSARADSIAQAGGFGGPPADSFPILSATNAADSARASAWAVRLEQTNTKSGAILDLRGRFETVPAGTYGYDLRTRFYLLVAGAYPTRPGAESLLVQLRNRKVLAQGIGSVTSLPFAFMVQPDVPAADVASRLARFAARGQPVYALRQTNGTANLYFGAYESAQQAALAVPTVREAGLTPTLVYRIGRVF
jgi:hypothetical protein